MKIGKLPEPVLIRSVLKQVKHRREEVLVGPAVGQDCAALEVGEDEVLVMSTDPITGTAKDLGHHSIHITANDLAAAGADPVGVMLTVMLPDTVEEPEIRKMMQDAEETCEKTAYGNPRRTYRDHKRGKTATDLCDRCWQNEERKSAHGIPDPPGSGYHRDEMDRSRGNDDSRERKRRRTQKKISGSSGRYGKRFRPVSVGGTGVTDRSATWCIFYA